MLTADIQKIILNINNSQIMLLSDVNFTLEQNQIYTIVGKNGTGKSTFIKSLTGLLDNRFYTIEGKVNFEGRDLLSLKEIEINEIRKQKIKYVFQDARNSFDQLKKMKYYFNNLSLSAAEIDKTLTYFLLPKSNELFSLYPYEVSGGMAQRVSLTLALLSNPSLIILDEPTSGVDSAIANLFLLKLKEFVSEGIHSVLLVTQDLSFAKTISDKIALISNGTLSNFLSPDEFFKSKEITQSDNLLNSYLQLSV